MLHMDTEASELFAYCQWALGKAKAQIPFSNNIQSIDWKKLPCVFCNTLELLVVDHLNLHFYVHCIVSWGCFLAI